MYSDSVTQRIYIYFHIVQMYEFESMVKGLMSVCLRDTAKHWARGTFYEEEREGHSYYSYLLLSMENSDEGTQS